MSPITDTTNKTRAFEMTAVLATAGGKFLFMDYLNWRFAFIAATILYWMTYLLYRRSTGVDTTKYWGFRIDNFTRVLRILLPFALLVLIACVVIGLFRSTINITWHILPILVLYPIWGVFQQYLLIALVVGNLRDLEGVHLGKPTIIAVAALLFGCMHYPYPWLMLGTFILAIFYGIVYLRDRNLYVLGIFHGWLAGIFYYTVVGRDPFIETFGPLLHLGK